MPGFSRDGDVFFASFITGPQHVRVGLRLAQEPVEPRLVEGGALGTCSHGEWDTAKLIEAVDHGLQKASEEGVRRYYASEIHYLVNDTPSRGLAARCAHAIAMRHASGWDSDAAEDT